jgi:hypothetical protein
MRAASQDTSVSALVRDFLSDIANGETEAERLKREEARLRDSIVAFSAGSRLDRERLHARDA